MKQQIKAITALLDKKELTPDEQIKGLDLAQELSDAIAEKPLADPEVPGLEDEEEDEKETKGKAQAEKASNSSKNRAESKS